MLTTERAMIVALDSPSGRSFFSQCARWSEAMFKQAEVDQNADDQVTAYQKHSTYQWQ